MGLGWLTWRQPLHPEAEGAGSKHSSLPMAARSEASALSAEARSVVSVSVASGCKRAGRSEGERGSVDAQPP